MNYITRKVKQEKKKLYDKYVTDDCNAKHNKDRIDFVLDKVYKKQLQVFNPCEQKVKKKLIEKGFHPKAQKIIPVCSEGGRLEHLYIADLVVGKTIVEIDGKQHKDQKEWDSERDEYTKSLGYKTIRIPTSDLSDETIDSYLSQI